MKKRLKKVEPLENLADGKPVGQIIKPFLAIDFPRIFCCTFKHKTMFITVENKRAVMCAISSLSLLCDEFISSEIASKKSRSSFWVTDVISLLFATALVECSNN